jgi:hypothetical protein
MKYNFKKKKKKQNEIQTVMGVASSTYAKPKQL